MNVMAHKDGEMSLLLHYCLHQVGAHKLTTTVHDGNDKLLPYGFAIHG